MHTKTVDFTQGNIVKSIVVFSLPIVLGELIQNLYNSVDAMVVGNLVSKSALAAVTVGGVVANMIIMFFNGMSVGANVVISHAFGQSDEEALCSKIRIAFTFSLLLGVLLSAFGILFTPQLLQFAGVQDEYYAEALVYLRIYLAGLMFTVIYNNGAGILRAVGNSKTPFHILVIASCTNIVLDLFFAGVLGLGIEGVALATVLSQGLSTTLVYQAISRSQKICCIDFYELCHDGKKTVSDILSIGMAAGMQSALIGFSNIFVVRYMNLFDSASVAGIGIAQRLDKFVILPAKSFGITITTYMSQNIGAQHIERMREGQRKCLLTALGVTIFLSAVICVFAEKFVMLFNSDPDVVSVGIEMLYVLVPMFWVMAVREVYLGILRGYGKSVAPMLLSLFGMIVVRQTYLAITMRGENPAIKHIYYCYPIAWAVTTGLLICYYLLTKKTLNDFSEE